MQKKITIGIVGCSRIAENSVIPAILKSKFAKLHYIGSRDKKKAKKFATKFKCTNYGSYEDVIDDKTLDVVYISLPVALHEEWAVRAAKRGKHILCEKSSTTSFESAKKMANYAKNNGVRLMEGLMFRFHPSHKKVSAIIEAEKIGKIFSFYGSYGFPPISHDDIRYKKNLGGGILNDAACYPICASRIIFKKEPIQVGCDFIIDKNTNIDEKAVLFLKYSKTEFATITVGYGLYYQNFYSVWGKEGFLQLSRAYNIPPDMKAVITLYTQNRNSRILISPANHFVLMIDFFCKQVLQQSRTNFDFENDLLRQAYIMDCVRKSAKLKKYIDINNVAFINNLK